MHRTRMAMRPPASRAMQHIVAAKSGPVLELIADTLRQCHSRYSPLELLTFGGVYHRPSFKKVHPVRVLDPALVVQKGEYVRVHPDPRRYEAVREVDWAGRVTFECDDFLVIDKPAGVPTVPALDNVNENVLSCLRSALSLPAAWAPHRLDVDTSGLLLVAKTAEFCRHMGLVFSGKRPAVGRVTKLYRALVATEEQIDGTVSTTSTSSSSSMSSGMGPLRVGQTLVHYQLPSSSSPKIFTSQPYVPVASPAGGGRVAPGTDPESDGQDEEEEGGWASHASKTSGNTSSSTSSTSSSTSSSASKQCVSKVVGLSRPMTRSRQQWIDLGRAAGGEGSHLAHATSAWMAAAGSGLGLGPGLGHGHGQGMGTSVTLQEVTLELVTGRTHQARGQLQAIGSGCHSHYHICGDNNYTGCTSTPAGQEDGYRSSPYLALQAASLEFSYNPAADRARNGGREGRESRAEAHAALVLARERRGAEGGVSVSSSSSSASASATSAVARSTSASTSTSGSGSGGAGESVRRHAFKLGAAFWAPLLR